jgi:hypothetical protein
MDIQELERLLAEARQKEAVKEAFVRIDNAIISEAHITHIEAQDAAESHRSLLLVFTVEESKRIFETVRTILEARSSE